MDRETIRQLIVESTEGCNIQHDGWPCGTCFLTINFPPTYTPQEYWEAVLAYRGDYSDPQKDYYISPKPEILKNLVEWLEKEVK